MNRIERYVVLNKVSGKVIGIYTKLEAQLKKDNLIMQNIFCEIQGPFYINVGKKPSYFKPPIVPLSPIDPFDDIPFKDPIIFPIKPKLKLIEEDFDSDDDKI